VRKLHRHIDAEMRGENAPELRLIYDDRVIYVRRWTTVGEAEADAAAKLADLQRAGWTEHW
jgi:hypothetical protein